ncbi:BPSL0067 family protein [Acidovorax sp. GBBC 3334]|uniref:BPSL0067 family protein n=1 Tax=Acidovorax sp. GBBC 3334 TaxID=2940496 RepID=UPI002302113F|nr:BPSL0067 family protein [Acidovorax sp. GBBC 3334]MDA8453433.1 BPSL0067 family protein [Acidovorax sp. GBBC 3334]
MPYVYNNPETLKGLPSVGTKQCVALVKAYAKTPASSLWKEGAAVKGNTLLAKGTAIATFVDGRYPNKATGNHAALYVGQDAGGIYVIDQWSSSGTIQSRKLPFLGKGKNGSWANPSGNDDAFSVVE